MSGHANPAMIMKEDEAMVRFAIPIIMIALATPAAAQDYPADFAAGPVFETFGPHIAVDDIVPFPAHTEIAHSFDVAERAGGGARNGGFEIAARFINMHAANGVDPADMRVALVVHGPAVLDMLTDEALAAREGEDGPNASGDMVREMIGHGVRFIICGQSATGQGVSRGDLIDGAEMALSAMTAHAMLQQQGYTVNPF